MIIPTAAGRRPRSLELARVLLVDDEVASRLTLQTLLEAAGYSVDVAASAAEALGKLDEQEYELVLSDLEMESPQAGLNVLAYARVQQYKPATALVTSYRDKADHKRSEEQQQVTIKTENILSLLGKVADLLALRATRRSERALRQLAG